MGAVSNLLFDVEEFVASQPLNRPPEDIIEEAHNLFGAYFGEHAREVLEGTYPCETYEYVQASNAFETFNTDEIPF
jgi:hypothetical protein